LHLKAGHWEQAIVTIEATRKAWELKKQETQPQQLTSARLALHVNTLPLPARTLNLIENLCAGTIGALLEAFPAEFIGCPKCGPLTIEGIAKALIQAGLIDAEEALRRVEDWHLAMGAAA
jgi:hypothetical protein